MSDDTTHFDPPASMPSGSDRSDDADLTEGEAAGTARARYGPEDDPVVTIVELVADVTNQDVTAMPPLFDTVDPEALSELVASDTAREHPVNVTFSYQNCRISVSNRGEVVAEAPAQ